jgi:hypothetical protein
MRRWSALVLAFVLPAFGAAQSIVVGAPAAPTPLVDQFLRPTAYALPGLSNLQATPLWSTPDGRVLAIVAMADNIVPSKPQSPQIGSGADWKFVDVTNFVTSGLLFNINRDAAAYATLSRGAVVGPLYAPSSLQPCAATPVPLALDATCDRATLARSTALRVGAGWTILDDLDLDLSYGLSWLHHQAPLAGQAYAPIDVFAAVNNAQFPTLLIPGLEGADVQNAGLSALGHWRLGDPGTLNFGASLSRLQLYVPNTPPLTSLNQAAVTFGLTHGSFSGALTGRVLGPADAFGGNTRWAGLDIGFSWHTPWQGELSFGTQNLWSSGAVPNLAEPGSREVEANQARVPYVQYHQDL